MPTIESVDPLYHALRETAEKSPPGGKTTVGYLHGDLVYIALLEPEPERFWRVWHFTADTAVRLAASLMTQGEYAMIANGMDAKVAREKAHQDFLVECNRIIDEWNENNAPAEKSKEPESVSDDLIG